MPTFTKSQQNVIDYRGKNMLVSASAGTGKTTVMIERIATLIAEGVDISQIVVVTFTNLAAAEMKNRLAAKLLERRGDRRIAEQLEKLDNAAICTIDSFCSDLLRNYFYVVDIDPSFTILDSVTVASLRKNALDDVFREYFKSGDEVFKKTYSIFATKRREENFKNVLMSLYEFSRCLPDFYTWYQQTRQNFTNLQSADNKVVNIILQDICRNVQYFVGVMARLERDFIHDNLPTFAEVCQTNAQTLQKMDLSNLQSAFDSIGTFKLVTLPARSKKVTETLESERARANFAQIRKEIENFQKKYQTLCRGERVEKLFEETACSVLHTDKLVEILQKFEETFFALKKQRGGVDFGDLEHLALALLRDTETAAAVRERYQYVFVDEYQDTNPLQEELLSLLAANANLFVVGDIKQSIYGFRGCEPGIFLAKYHNFKKQANACVEELNENFRSNSQILQFVNEIFGIVMTEDFGKVDYARHANLQGEIAPSLQTPSVQIDLVVKAEQENQTVEDIYDITAEISQSQAATQGEVIADKINRFVGMAYKDKNGNSQRINYGDIVILMRSMKDKAVNIYNTLIEHNIPVMANFKLSGYANKEVRDLITLLRAIDNPYNDIYTVGACLAPYGGFTENDLAQIKIATTDGMPFYVRLQTYLECATDSTAAPNASIAHKIEQILQLFDELRFFSHSATVDEVVLQVLQKTNFQLYVQGLPNGALRLRKMYAFIDELKGAAYAQSIERFLSYLDDTDEVKKEEGISGANAVRIMTMHASKGLEFPIVIVAATETNFNNDRSSVESNNDLGLATKYYDFSTMRFAGTLGVAACGMFNHVKLQEEEMRLLYVALTRAKFVLNVVGTVREKQLSTMPKRVSVANSHLDWLLTALKHKHGNLQAVAQTVGAESLDEQGEATSAEHGVTESSAEQSTEQSNVAEQITIVRETSVRATERENLMVEQYTDMDAVESQLSYRYPYQNETKMPSKIVSSALDKEYIDADADGYEPVLIDNNDRNFVGTAYHKVYQYVKFGASKQQIEQAIEGLVREGKVERQYAEQLDVDLIVDTLNNAQLRKLMDGATVYHEMPFMLYVPYNSVAGEEFTDEVMLQGVIDLLIISSDKTHATVVDFKYSTHSVDYLREHYAKQLASYRLAVQKICGIQNVDCYVLSIAENELIKM